MGVADNPKEKSKIDNFDIDFPEEIKSATSEIEVTQQTLKNGNMLMNLGMPEKTLVIMVKRGEVYFVPTGKTILKEKDKLLIITDDDDALAETYRDLGHA
jgi:potassium/hydrogen antiporter